jgi:hypothetical protein
MITILPLNTIYLFIIYGCSQEFDGKKSGNGVHRIVHTHGCTCVCEFEALMFFELPNRLPT